MSTLQELIITSDHHQITQLDDSYAPYKCIAFIHLEMYEEALKLATPNSFEFFYCLYKLKKYKKCVRGINKLSKKTDGINVVLAQALYYLGYYTSSFKILEKIKNSGVPINLRATLSLINASRTDKIHRFAVHNKDTTDEKLILKKSNLDNEEMLEYEFNECFEYLADESEYVKTLENKVSNVLCMIQLNNITGNYEDISPEFLSTRQSEIVNANKEGSVLENPMHFQKVNKEFDIFNAVSKDGINKKITTGLHGSTKKLYILKLYSDIKRGKVDEKRIRRVKDERMRKMLLFLNNGTRDKINEVLKMIKQ